MAATKTKIKKQVAYFTVMGEFVTRQARDFWTEGNMGKALDLLLVGMHGIDEPLAIQIITGKKKIIGMATHGKNTIDVVDDDKEEHNGISLSLHDNFKRADKRLIKPEMNDPIIEDNDKDETSDFIEKAERALNRQSPIIDDDYLMQSVIATQKIAMISGFYISNERALESAKMTAGLIPRNKAVISKEATSPSGYLTSDGEYYPCSYMGHTDLESDLDQSDDSLLSKGWIKVSEMKLITDRPPTEQQIKFILKLIERWGVATLGMTKVSDEKQLRDAIEGEARFDRFEGEKKIRTERDGD